MMQPRKNKSVLIIIIILLVIMASFSIISIYFKFSAPNKVSEEIPKEEQTEEPTIDNANYKDGKLYFYDKDNNLIGDYTCKKAPCSYAVSEIDDKNYAIDYLETKTASINVLLNNYAFINDNNNVILYKINTKEEIETFKAVKNYDNMMPEEYVIVKDSNNKWGIIKLGENIERIANFDYDFIGIKNILINNKLDVTNFIIKKENLWGIIDNTGDLMSNYLSGEITSFNDVLISVKNNDIYYLYDYNGKRVVDENGFNYISFVDKFINIVDKNNNLYIYDYINDKKISSNMNLKGKDYKEAFQSSYNKETNTIDVNIDGKVYNYNVS